MTDTPHAGATRYAGSRVQRVEDPRLLTGHGTFVDDIQLPGMLHACFVRSPHRARPHRRHRRIRCQSPRRRARHLPRRGPQPRRARAVVHVARSRPERHAAPAARGGRGALRRRFRRAGAGGRPLRRRGRRRHGRGRLRPPARRSSTSSPPPKRPTSCTPPTAATSSGAWPGAPAPAVEEVFAVGPPRRHLDGGSAVAVGVPDGDARHRGRPQLRERRDHHLCRDAGSPRGPGLRCSRLLGVPENRVRVDHPRHRRWVRPEDHGHARRDVPHARRTEGARAGQVDRGPAREPDERRPVAP